MLKRVLFLGPACLGALLAFAGPLPVSNKVHFPLAGSAISLRAPSPAQAQIQPEIYRIRNVNDPITLQAADQNWTITPHELGVSTFGESLAQFDPASIRAFLDRTAAQFDRPPTEAQLIRTASGSFEITPSLPGRVLDKPKSLQRIIGHLGDPQSDSIVLPYSLIVPWKTEADLAPERDRANRLIGRPIQLASGDERWIIDPPELATIIGFLEEPVRGTSVSVDLNKLSALLDSKLSYLYRQAMSPRFDVIDGTLRPISAGAEGQAVDQRLLVKRVLDALEGDGRLVEVPLQRIRPLSVADLPGLGIKEIIQQTQTDYSGGLDERRHNVEMAASRLNGRLLAPGELFSFNRTVGPTTLQSGFKWAFGASESPTGAIVVPSVAGGICQVATTLFQAIFWSGLQIEERHAHPSWIPRYGQPPTGLTGLDATVEEEMGLDFQFVNNSGHYVLINASTNGKQLTIRIYGTIPAWQVQVVGPVVDQIRQPNPTELEQPDLTIPVGERRQVESAGPGFRASITRTVTEAGRQRTMELKTTYQPSRNVVMVGTKSISR